MITITGFGPFGRVKHNPSGVLAKLLHGERAVILPVSYAAVDEFVQRIPAGTTQLLMLGVAPDSKYIRLERAASDERGQIQDNDGESRCCEKTDTVRGSLFDGIEACSCWKDSFDAGKFLCNYLYYRTTKARPEISTGFVHVPPFTVMPMPIQLVRLRRLLNLITQK